MECAGCASGLRGALEKVQGIERAEVDYATGRAEVTGSASGATIEEAIRARGFTPSPEVAAGPEGIDPLEAMRDADRRARSRARAWGLRAALGLGLWVPLESLHWLAPHHRDGGGGGGGGGAHGSVVVDTLLLVGSTIAVAIVGSGFFASAWRAALHRTTNMDTLISMGVLAAYLLSLATYVAQRFGRMDGSPLWFAEAVAILGIVSLGHYLEARASAKAGGAVEELLALQPEVADVRRSGGATERVAVVDVRAGDEVVVRPGGRLPVDGVVVEGEAALDESALTGEPLPVATAVGSTVRAGAIATDGALVVRAASGGRSTSLARIASIVLAARSSRAPIQRLADRVSSIFVPVVLSVAFVTVVGWTIAGRPVDGVLFAVTVLVISCPCALGIATPLAVMVGAGEASRRGMLVKDAATLERASTTRSVVFDKTGTLTMGRPEVASIEAVSGDARELLRLAAAVEARSEHPIARAILRRAEADGLGAPAPTREFRAIAGQGVEGLVELDGLRRSVRVVRDERASCRVEVDGVLAGRIAVADEPRAESRAAVAMLAEDGIRTTLLSGDRREAAESIGRAVGIPAEAIVADATPESKVEAIASFGPGTVMVGDGINDAAALARADVGIAMGGGTGLAIESAPIVLLSDDPRGVASVLRLARATMRAIRQNLFLAFVYNASAIPIAAFGLLGARGPLIAAAAMGLSDLCVVGNALRLKAKLKRQRGSAVG